MQRIIDRLSRFTGIQCLPGQSQNDMRFIGSLHMVPGFVYNHPGVQNVVMGHIEFVYTCGNPVLQGRLDLGMPPLNLYLHMVSLC